MRKQKRIKCYDFSQLSLKFERCLDAEIVDFKVISDDYSKIVLLGSDRSLEFHTPQGKHHKIRVPKFGRELSFYPANRYESYRLNTLNHKSFISNHPLL